MGSKLLVLLLGLPRGHMVYRFAEYQLDLSRRVLLKGGTPVPLSPTALEVLRLLLEHPGHSIPRRKLQDQIDLVAGAQALSLDEYIEELDRALGEAPTGERWIEAASGDEVRFIRAAIAEGSSAETGIGPSHVVATTQGTEGYLGNEMFQWQAQPRRRSHAHWIATLLLLASVTVILYFSHRNRPEPLPVTLESRQLTHDGQNKVAFVLSPDGTTAWYSSLQAHTLCLWQLSISDGNVHAIEPELAVNELVEAVSKDGKELLVARFPGEQLESSSLWQVDRNGSNAKLLVSGGWSGAWSPDGRQLAYSRWNDHGVYLAHPDGSGAHRIARVPGYPWYLAWSPEGGRLLMSSINTLKPSSIRPEGPLYRVFVDTGRTRSILDDSNNAVVGAHPLITSDHLHILFTHTSGDIANVWEVDRMSGHMLAVTSNKVNTRLAAMGPGSNQIVTAREILRSRLFRLSPQQHRMEPFPASIETRDMAFSPDGHWIAYVDFNGALWQAKADGSQPVRLLDAKWKASEPAWAPDNRQLIVSAAPQGGLKKLYRIPAMGTPADASANPISFGMGTDEAANWTPDRNHVVFCRTISGISQLEWLNLDSGSLQTISDSRGKCSPQMSPQGALSAIAPTNHTLFVRKSLTARWDPIVTDPDGIHDNFWSHDGQSLYFLIGTSPGRWKRYDMSSGRVSTVADLGTGLDWAAGPWHSLSLTANDDVVIASDISGNEDFVLTLGADE